MKTTQYLTQAKLATSLLLLSIATPQALAQNLPSKAPVREVKDTYFGQTITDPYRWMEDLQLNLLKISTNYEITICDSPIVEIWCNMRFGERITTLLGSFVGFHSSASSLITTEGLNVKTWSLL